VDVASVPTNIVVADVASAPEIVAAAAEQGVLIGAVGPRTIRLLTHLDVTRPDAERAAEVLAQLLGC
jgi:threonine aldolase